MSIAKRFWVYIKNWACLKNLSMLEPNFEEADGLGISYFILSYVFLGHNDSVEWGLTVSNNISILTKFGCKKW